MGQILFKFGDCVWNYPFVICIRKRYFNNTDVLIVGRREEKI